MLSRSFYWKILALQGLPLKFRDILFLGIILARAAAADHVHRRQLRPVQFGDVPHMDHVGEMVFRYFDGKGFDLAGPEGFNPRPDRRQWEAAEC